MEFLKAIEYEDKIVITSRPEKDNVFFNVGEVLAKILKEKTCE